MTVGRGSLLDIQKAIMTTLTGNVALMAMITGVFDFVPVGQQVPYVEIGEGTETKFNTFDRQGKETSMTINVWSGYAGYLEAETIMNEIIGLLDYTNISISNYNLVYCRYGEGSSIKETFDAGKTRRISGRFELMLQQT
jgi:hypothetical protein